MAFCCLCGLWSCSLAPDPHQHIDPDVYQLDPPRGIQIDVASGNPTIHCDFSAAGGARHALFHEMESPDALWRYFAPSTWRLVGHCDNRAVDTHPGLVYDSVPQLRYPGRVWLITAWDSLSHSRWGQLERYSVETAGGVERFTFGRPAEGGLPANFVTVTVSDSAH